MLLKFLAFFEKQNKKSRVTKSNMPFVNNSLTKATAASL